MTPDTPQVPNCDHTATLRKGWSLVTRQRWDCYFVPAILIATWASIVCYAEFGELRFLLSAGGLIGLWLWLRFTTPLSGIPSPTITGTPGTVQLLAWLGFVLLLAASGSAVDFFLLGTRWNDPLEGYRLLLYSPVFVVLFAGVWFIEKHYIHPNQRSPGQT